MTTIEQSNELACALNGYRALIIPDLHNSNQHHWLNVWEKNIPRSRRILMHDWSSPDWVKWRNSIIASLISIDEPVVLIAEGFGALAAASVAAEYPGKIIAAFFVDPADPEEFDLRKKIPKQHLPVPTKITLRAQTHTKSALLAALWSADLSNSQTQSQDEFWPEGTHALQRLMNKTQHKAEELTQARTKKVLAYLRGIQTHQSRQMRLQHS